MTRGEAIKWMQAEKASLERAPDLNGCPMTAVWQEAIDVYDMAISALRAQQTIHVTDLYDEDGGEVYRAQKESRYPKWISVNDELPKLEKGLEPWRRYNVVVLRSHWPTSSYDLCDAPYDEEFVTTAAYDSEQKIWHLDWGEQLNALIDIDDSPLNGDYVTHWMPLPEPPEEGTV